ncbi:hypothetical protein D3C77_154700 [compost metagenome]
MDGRLLPIKIHLFDAGCFFNISPETEPSSTIKQNLEAPLRRTSGAKQNQLTIADGRNSHIDTEVTGAGHIEQLCGRLSGLDIHQRLHLFALVDVVLDIGHPVPCRDLQLLVQSALDAVHIRSKHNRCMHIQLLPPRVVPTELHRLRITIVITHEYCLSVPDQLQVVPLARHLNPKIAQWFAEGDELAGACCKSVNSQHMDTLADYRLTARLRVVYEIAALRVYLR